MQPLPWKLALATVLLSQAALPQPVQPPQGVASFPRETPRRIRVGCQAQTAYIGPAQGWFNNGTRSLSDQQIAQLEESLSTHPDDVCARGYLIAHGQDRVPDRTRHVLWMIEHHPEWDGFLLNLSPPGSRGREDAYERVRAAWLRQVGNDQRSGAVLHNAAIFFEWREPDFAVTLFERAIRLEPAVSLHVETLGALYGRSQLGARNPAFAARAKSTLLASNDWLIVAGALSEFRSHRKGSGGRTGDFEKQLLERLGSLTGNPNAIGVLAKLPSQTGQYPHSQCDLVPLLRGCDDAPAP